MNELSWSLLAPNTISSDQAMHIRAGEKFCVERQRTLELRAKAFAALNQLNLGDIFHHFWEGGSHHHALAVMENQLNLYGPFTNELQEGFDEYR